jgi:hypothetical protein
MKIQNIILIFLLMTSLKGISQSERFVCNGNIIRFTNGNINHYRKIVCCPTLKVSKNKFPERIIDSAYLYLINRIGNSFYKKLSQPIYEEVRLDLVDSLKLISPCASIENCQDTTAKYAIGYNFDLPKGMKYYFTLIYNKKGELISNEQLPYFNSNTNCFNIIEPCLAIEIADNDSVYKQKTNQITLNYSKSLNSFIWAIKKNEYKKEFTEDTYCEPNLVLDANTGIIIERYIEEKTSVCHQRRIPYPKLKK